MQEVFLHGLYAVTGTNLSRVQDGFQEVKTMEKAHEIINAAPRQNFSSRSISENLVWTYILILMVLEADSRGPENLQGLSGIPKSILVEMMFNVAHYIAKTLNQLKTSDAEDKDLDSDGNVARRTWTVTGILCRWHGVSVAEPDLFGLNEAATWEDRKAFGIVILQLARESQL